MLGKGNWKGKLERGTRQNIRPTHEICRLETGTGYVMLGKGNWNGLCCYVRKGKLERVMLLC